MRTVDDVADVRTGDKGDTLILAVFPRTDEDYELLNRELTAAVVTVHFAPLVTGKVRRTEMPLVSGLVFELPGVLGGGVTGSPVLDGHGKCLSYHLLSLAVPEER
ncbi:MAG: AtuA-related protein [Rhodococcus sp. (in: high G+C Gram-positive bacteria)]